jgi:hypothetical protein
MLWYQGRGRNTDMTLVFKKFEIFFTQFFGTHVGKIIPRARLFSRYAILSARLRRLEMPEVELSTKLVLTGQRVDKITVNGGRLIIDIPQETLDLFNHVVNDMIERGLGYTVEEGLIIYLAAQKLKDSPESDLLESGDDFRSRRFLTILQTAQALLGWSSDQTSDQGGN